jgi:DNA-binding NarL/FixJ family response regulator
MARSSAGRKRVAPITVVIADDHRTFAEALGTTLRLERGIEVTAVVDDRQAVDAIREQLPDVLIVSVDLPEADALNIIRETRRTSPETRVLAITEEEGATPVAMAVEAGAAAVLSKRRPVKDVARSVRAAYRGEPLMDPEALRHAMARLRRRRRHDASAQERLDRLTRRELQILGRVAEGVPSARVAQELGISAHTVRTHVQNILFKLKVHSKMEAVAVALRHGKIGASRS